MMTMSPLHKTNTLSWIFISANSLKQQSADRHVAPLRHIILFQANPYLLFLLTAVCLAEKQNYQYYSLWFDPTRARANVQPHLRQACLQLQNIWRIQF